MNNHITDYLRAIGKRGGEKTKERGIEHYKAIGRAGALKRWGTNAPADLTKMTWIRQPEEDYRCKDPMCRAFMVEHYHKGSGKTRRP